jgi:hypothetical protein
MSAILQPPGEFVMNGTGARHMNHMIAALQGASSQMTQAVLDDFARRLVHEGFRVAGVVEIAAPESTGACGRLALRNLATMTTTAISQNLGPGSTSCNLDPAGLAEACAAVERCIAAGADLVIISKFGKQEAARSGLSDAFRAAMAAELPILTSVSPAMSDAWNDFSGPLSQFLPVDPEAVRTWWTQARIGRRLLAAG